MSKVVTVIGTKCVREAGGTYRTVGERLFQLDFPEIGQAIEEARQRRRKGLCVIVRPQYSETDTAGDFYREWWSFDGEPSEQIIFRV